MIFFVWPDKVINGSLRSDVNSYGIRQTLTIKSSDPVAITSSSKGQKSKSVTNALCPLIFGVLTSTFLGFVMSKTHKAPPPYVCHGNATHLLFAFI